MFIKLLLIFHEATGLLSRPHFSLAGHKFVKKLKKNVIELKGKGDKKVRQYLSSVHFHIEVQYGIAD